MLNKARAYSSSTSPIHELLRLGRSKSPEHAWPCASWYGISGTVYGVGCKTPPNSIAMSKVFDHAAHAQHRWRRFLNHDSKNYAGFSVMAGGLQFAKVVGSHKRAKGIAYLTKKTAEKLPKLMVYPLVLGVTGAEVLVWGTSYFNDGKDDETSKVARNAKLAPAAFAVYGTTLNSVYPLVGRWRRVRGWLRPIKWGAIGLAIDYAFTKITADQSKT